MRIGIIGATGMAGQAIYRESVRRGEDTVALVRDAAKAHEQLGDSAIVLEKDAFDLSQQDLAGFDAIVNAVAFQFTSCTLIVRFSLPFDDVKDVGSLKASPLITRVVPHAAERPGLPLLAAAFLVQLGMKVQVDWRWIEHGLISFDCRGWPGVPPPILSCWYAAQVRKREPDRQKTQQRSE